MTTNKIKRKDIVEDLQIVRGLEGKPTNLHYVETACKFGKELDLTWSNLYQSFTHEDYSQLPFDEGMEKKAKEVFQKITRAYLHKGVT